MKRRHFFLLSLFSIVRPAVSFAGQPSHNLESLRRKLEAVSSFSCTFRQTKTLLGQNFSLVSTGTLEVHRRHGHEMLGVIGAAARIVVAGDDGGSVVTG